MSMMVKLSSPQGTEITFDEDSGNGSLKSLDPVSATAYGAYAPGPVEIKSSSSQTKAGVSRTNISVRVPLCSFDKEGNLLQVDAFENTRKGQNRPKFVQVSLTVSIPNASGLIGSAKSTEDGVPTDQISANLSATALGLSILCTLIGKQGSMADGEDLVTADYHADAAGGTFNPHNPLARGAAGMVPVDPNQDRSLIAAE